MIRVFITDDHALVREGIKRFLADQEGIVVIGEADCAEDMLVEAEAAAWDVLLLDLTLPDLSGLEALKRVKKIRPRMKVVIVTMQDEDQVALRILKGGADGYVTKGHPPEDIVTAIRRVFEGGKHLSPRLASLLLSSKVPAGVEAHESLSDREREVLTALAGGRTSGAIATALGVSPSTVSTHLSRIKQKLDIDTVHGLVRYAIEAGIV